MNNTTAIPKESYLEKFFPELKTLRAQNYATILLTLFSSAVFGIFAISPTISTIVGLNKQISDFKQADQELSTKISNLSNLDQAYQQLQPDLNLVTMAIPSDPKAAELVGKIQQVATQNHITLTTLQTGGVDYPITLGTQSPPANLTITLSAQGNTADLQNFTNTLANIDRIINITSISISTTSQTTISSTTPQLNIQALAFYKPI